MTVKKSKGLDSVKAAEVELTEQDLEKIRGGADRVPEAKPAQPGRSRGDLTPPVVIGSIPNAG